MTTYWVSFADEDGFLGVAVVEADDDSDAATVVKKTIDLGCNPGGGGVQIQKLPNDHAIPPRFQNRLLTLEEVKLLNAGGFGLMSLQ